MRPFQSTIPLDEARAIIDGVLQPLDRTEIVPLSDANGRVLARTIVSTVDVPPFARAGMDGYAVRTEDTAGATREAPAVLRCVERIFTGHVPTQVVGPGECSEIATGAPMPAGADAVVMVEDTDGGTGHVRIFTQARQGQQIGQRGTDILSGQVVLDPSTLLNASRIGSLAALGLANVQVYAKPRVALLSTGDEIVDPGEPLALGQIYDINRFTLAAVVRDHGGVPVLYRTVGDTLDALSRAVHDALEQDVLVFSGGSSVGERDLILDVIQTHGELLFHGISVKPGKPTALGRIRDKLVFGMPGYPTSCLSNAYILLAPALRRIARLPAQTTRSVTLPLAQRITSVKTRHQFYTVKVRDGVAFPAFKASGDITSMSQADGYIEIPAGTDTVEPGTLVTVTLF